MHSLNRSSLAFVSVSILTLLAGCEKPQPPQTTQQPAGTATTPAPNTARQNGTSASDHAQYIPISKDGIDSLKVSDPLVMRIERNNSKQYPEAGYWLGLGPNKALSPSNKFATVTFDLEDLGNTPYKAAGVLVDQGWAMSIRKYLFPPPRTKRISSGTPRDYREATRLAVIDGVLSAANDADQTRSNKEPPTIAEDPDAPEILVYCHIPKDGTSIAEDWVLYRKVQGATEEVTYNGYTEDGQAVTERNEDGKSKGSVTLQPGTWAIFNRATNTWKHMGEIPAQTNPPAILGFETLLDEVKKTTGRSFYKQVSGGTNPTDPADPPSSTNPTNPSDSAPK